jgi:hypothetical protein
MHPLVSGNLGKEMAAQDYHHQLQEHQSHEVAVVLAVATKMAMRLVQDLVVVMVGLAVVEIETQVLLLAPHQIKMEERIKVAVAAVLALVVLPVVVPEVQDLLSFDIYCKNASV